ncbi:hypothetical protein GAH_00505 [Geoglobus ahangari]|uniref:Uncharacterized protein n=1 Tax=Geoglobus ahangari TaxID=113653 RepID=A0A0F7IGZ0_9EURY|nr:hypothetical protein [Geoglobus ahangari]AKG92148.1 hypothetical protein GAH_00505 [Geoglobus ahangari]
MRVILITIILFTLGVFVLPSTISFFAGQHYWYNISEQGNQIPCEKCHADVRDELANSPHHSALTCEHCHRGVNLSGQPGGAKSYASDFGGDVYPGSGAHAASVLSCLICHSGYKSDSAVAYNHSHYEYACSNDVCHSPVPNFHPPEAGGLGVTGLSYDTGIYAAHREFAIESKKSDLLFDVNEACIACHTQVWLLFNYTSASGISIVVNNTYTSTQSSWQIESSSVATTVYRINSTDRTVKGTYEVVR